MIGGASRRETRRRRIWRSCATSTASLLTPAPRNFFGRTSPRNESGRARRETSNRAYCASLRLHYLRLSRLPQLGARGSPRLSWSQGGSPWLVRRVVQNTDDRGPSTGPERKLLRIYPGAYSCWVSDD